MKQIPIYKVNYHRYAYEGLGFDVPRKGAGHTLMCDQFHD